MATAISGLKVTASANESIAGNYQKKARRGLFKTKTDLPGACGTAGYIQIFLS
jgi:hypothetical protein